MLSISRFTRQIQQRRFSAASESFLVKSFEGIVGKEGIVTDGEELIKYNTDWTGEFKGQSKLVVRPKYSQQVQEIMRFCHKNDISIVPQGGNTGLVGGSVPIKDEVILSLSRMNQIVHFDEALGSITCQAGVILQNADEYVRQRGYVMPLDLGSKGSCQVGGNIATNAGGIRFIRYGSLRGNVLGLEIVLSDGTILDAMRSLRKDNVGYDLKQLFIGSEGTLGIITSCTILAPPKPVASVVALLSLDSFEKVILALQKAKFELGRDLSAFEYFDSDAMQLVTSKTPFQNPLQSKNGQEARFFAIVEVAGQDESNEKSKMIDFLSKIVDDQIVSDGVLSENDRQYTSIWGLRENITSSLRSSGSRVFKYDVSLPSQLLNEATDHVRHYLKENQFTNIQVFQYGHVGDGNLHFNAACFNHDADYVNQAQNAIEKALYGYVEKHRGSISAEHGLGQLKARKILHSRSREEVKWMKQMKQTFDPKGLLNPGKVLV